MTGVAHVGVAAGVLRAVGVRPSRGRLPEAAPRTRCERTLRAEAARIRAACVPVAAPRAGKGVEDGE